MSEVSRLFDDAASDYDLGHHLNVPDPEGFYGAVVENLPFGTDEELRVLDLGAGTGLLSAVVAEKFPEAGITLVDVSEKMLELAQKRFAGSLDRFEFRVLDYVREPLPGGQEGYDLIVSALSFHHLTHADVRKALSRVHVALADGGWFVNADKAPKESSDAGGDDLARDHEHPSEGHHQRADLKTQMTWLSEAGFREVERYYEKDGFAVYGGRKSQRKGA